MTIPTSLGQALGLGLQQGVESGLQGLMQNYLAKKKSEQQFNELQKLFGQMSPSVEKTGEYPTVETSNIEQIATNPVLMTQIASINPQLANQVEKTYANQLAKQKFEFTKEQAKIKGGFISPERKTALADVMKKQIDLLKEGNIGLTNIGKLSPEAREQRSEFNTLSSSIEAALVPLVSKGALSKQRFNYILKNLPKARDTQAAIRGKLKALAREFEIDIPEFAAKKTEGKVLNKEIAQKILNATGGNKEKAREQAKKLGFEF